MASGRSIIVFCKTLQKGGAEKQALILSRLLTKSNLKITLVNWCSKELDSKYSECIKHNSIIYLGLTGNPFKKFIKLLNLTKETDECIIISYLTLANSIAGLSRLFNKRIISIGGIRSEKLPLHKILIEKLAHNYLNSYTVFNSYSAARKFTDRGFSSKKSAVIHNGIYVGQLERAKMLNETITLISVARFVIQKDIRTALLSFKKLHERNGGPNLKYLLVGYGNQEKTIRMLVRRLEIEKQVTIVINPPNIQELLRSSDIYLSTSLAEGLSNSIMEAMAVGLPVVATNVGDNRYLIEDASNGFIVPCKDTDAIVQKLEHLLSNADLRMEYGANSYSKIRNEFSEEQLLQKYLNLIEGLIISRA